MSGLTYLFLQAMRAEIAVSVVVYYILLGVWCLVAFLTMKQKHIVRLAEKYANVVVPFLYIGLGIYIVVKSSCYPWSFEHIDASNTTASGQTIMAVVTTLVLLLCIGVMSLVQLRKRAARPTPNAEDPEPRSSKDGPTAPQNLTVEENSLPNSHLPEQGGKDQ